MKKQSLIFCCLALACVAISFPSASGAADLEIEPALTVSVVYDDNLDFDQKDEIDDFGANAIPGLSLNYESELLQVSLKGEVDVLKYYSENDFDRTNQLYGFDSQYHMFPRWTIAGGFLFRRDESIDSELEETGQAFGRKRVTTYDGGGGLFYNLTELTDIGFDVQYRKREYSNEFDVDYDRYTFSLPYTKRFVNQRDAISFKPGYTLFDSDGAEDLKDYRVEVGWERLLTQTLTSNIDIGVRYTVIENRDNEDDDNVGYFGEVGLTKTGETYTGKIAFSRDIRANSEAEIIEVNRLLLKFERLLLERLGFKFYGSGYLSETESSNAPDDKTYFYEISPLFYFLVTENHRLELGYRYQNERESDKPGNPVTERNQVWLGFVLKFPQKW